jgi:large subunit ribosomal protein L2
MIDFRRDKVGIPGTVATIEYDPNRTARIALVHYKDGEKRYILAPHGLEVGREVIADDTADILPGNCLQLKAVPLGTWVHNVEMQPGRWRADLSLGRLLRAAHGEGGKLRAPPSPQRRAPQRARDLPRDDRSGRQPRARERHHRKAGRNRWLGIRPTTRGTAMNPIDHPHGGGEGKAKGRHPVTPWGKPTKGKKTRSKKKPSWRFIVSRRKK